MKYLSKLTILTAVFFIASCGSTETKSEETATTESTETEVTEESISSSEQTAAIVQHHLKAFGENDLDAIMEDYAENAIVSTPDSTYTGAASVRAFFEGLLPAFPTEGTEFTLDRMEANDGMGYIIWHATTPAVVVSFGTDTYIMENGKIKYQSFAGIITPVAPAE